MTLPSDKALALRTKLAGSQPVLLAGAHDALSARLVEEAGFDGVWASGFEVSASHGLPDASLVTMTQMLEAAADMDGAVSVPVIADCDGGFGNAVNVIHMMRLYERAGIAAVCIEDATFPKRCSFYDAHRELTGIDEQALKIRAACDARTAATVVIARTEALIAGEGLEAALARGRAYVAAGADCVLVHSKSRGPDEVLAFAAAWDSTVPLVAVPTTYGDISADQLWAAGFRVVIFANQGLRAAIRAVRTTLQQLRSEGRAAAVDDSVVPLADVFDLVQLDRLKRDERRYLTSAIVRATGDW